jgi:DNA-binding transcriptional regulator YiaG
MKQYRLIKDAAPAAGTQQALRVTWDDGACSVVDLSTAIAGNPVLAPLADSRLFNLVQVTADGYELHWTDDIELSAPQLWRWAMEQSGEAMPAEEFRRWRLTHKMSLQQAARILGLSRRMVAYYDAGAKPIPKTVALACIGAEHQLRSGR